MRTEVQAVFFDATNTLLEVRSRVGEVYARLATRHGLRVDANEVETRFQAALADLPQELDPAATAAAVLESERGWWRDLARRSFEPWCVAGAFPKFEAFFDEVFEHYRDAEAWNLLPGARETLTQLRAMGLRTGIISAMDSRLDDILTGFEIADFFDVVCLSFRTGYAKPDTRLFLAAAQQLGVEPGDAVHVGDSWGGDVGGARAAGLHAVHFDPHAEHSTRDGVHVIRTLPELPNVLAHLDPGAAL